MNDNRKIVIVGTSGLSVAALASLVKDVEIVDMDQKMPDLPEPPKLPLPSHQASHKQGSDHPGPHEYMQYNGVWICHWCGEVLRK